VLYEYAFFNSLVKEYTGMKSLVLTLFILVSFVSQAFAESNQITPVMLEKRNLQLEKVLNNREDFSSAIQTLHNFIDEKARFSITVRDLSAGQAESNIGMNLGKQEYINSYIHGTWPVQGYRIDIQSSNFQYDPALKRAYSKDIMTERGTLFGSHFQDRPFISRTICHSYYELEQGIPVLVSGKCHTDISYEENI
jgi:hypothetical protein